MLKKGFVEKDRCFRVIKWLQLVCKLASILTVFPAKFGGLNIPQHIYIVWFRLVLLSFVLTLQ